jgi:type II secretory pathway pseudopilin PulG
MKSQQGASLVEVMVSSALFSVFMMVALGLFTGMTTTVRREQQPGERLAEGRLAALAVARRLRNCQALIQPPLKDMILGASTDRLMLRDVAAQKTVELKLENTVLSESYYPFLYNPLKPDGVKPEKGLRLTSARSFQVTSGGVEFPTRVTVEIVLTDGRLVQAVTNFREAI